jgi:toxin CptA
MRGRVPDQPIPCLLDWRPSRLHCAALVLLGLLGGIGCLLSAAPRPLRIAGAMLACVQGLRLARREGARDPLQLQFAADFRSLRLGPPGNAVRITALVVDVRGTLASLQGLDAGGRVHRLAWWPDTLGPAGRRVLRIAAGAPIGSRVAETGSTLATMPGLTPQG